MSTDQNRSRNPNIKTGNNSFGRVEDFKYLGTTLTDKSIFRKKLEQIEVRDCLLSLGAKYFVYQFALQNYKV
jgi:hypothetical protein